MADKMPESALQQAVEDRCDALGIRHWHDHDARMNGPVDQIRVVSNP